MQPFVCLRSIISGAGSPTDNLTALPIFGRNASGFLSRHWVMAFWRSFSFDRLLKQFVQLHPLQNSPLAKQSQYNFKHCDFVQLHGFLLGTSFETGIASTALATTTGPFRLSLDVEACLSWVAGAGADLLFTTLFNTCWSRELKLAVPGFALMGTSRILLHEPLDVVMICWCGCGCGCWWITCA